MTSIPARKGINLLNSPLTQASLLRIVADAPRRPLLPPLGSPEWVRAAGTPLAARWLPILKGRAEREKTLPLPRLNDRLYALYHRTGNRLRFEQVYFERRRRLARVVIALLLSPRESARGAASLRRSALRKLEEILDEASWALPAHVNNPTGKDSRTIDLFCAETANLMAEMLDLLGPIIPDQLAQRIRTRLDRDIFGNYAMNHRDLWWTQSQGNWNAVCHQGVLGAALSQIDRPVDLAELLWTARSHLRHFLKGFGKDGGTSEGPAYWQYGFGWFTTLNEQLETRTAGALSLFSGCPKAYHIARFGAATSLAGGRLVNFADGSGQAVLRPALLSYLGERLNQEENREKARENYGLLWRDGMNFDSERCDLFQLGRLLLRAPRKAKAKGGNRVLSRKPDIFLPVLGVMVARGVDRKNHVWDVAAKAGHNAEFHNHNDCGSYLVNVDGIDLISEIGYPEYERDYFGPRRYEFLAARTEGHSLPVIGLWEQKEGREHAARVLRCHLGEERAEFALDASKCYPKAAGCRRFLRTLRFDKRSGSVSIEDEFSLSRIEGIEDAVITTGRVRIEQGKASIEREGLTLRLTPEAGTVLLGVKECSYKNHDGQPSTVRRILFGPVKPGRVIRLGYRMELT